MEEKLKILFIEESISDAEITWHQIESDKIQFIRKLVKMKVDYIEALGTFNPDIIISGYSLPEYNGMDALNIRNDIAPSVPFILVTASINERVAVDCMKAGADDYIIKKNLSRLGEAIKSAIKKRGLILQKDIAEKMMRESEENYRLMIDLSPDAIIVYSREGILYANPTALRFLGVDSLERIKNLDIISFVHADYKETARNRIKKIIKTGKPLDYVEEKFINLNNDIFDVEVIGFPVKYMGKPAVQTIIRDITERKLVEIELIKAKEKAEENDRLKTAFLHNISHEIRTPMNAIVGFSAILNEPDLSQETQRSYIDIITQSSDQLLAIVNDIVEISNIEVGTLKSNLDEINLNAQLNILFKQFNLKAAEQEIEFRLETSLSFNAADIHTDSSKLTQILSNLLSNAFKFTEHGHIEFGYKLINENIEFFVSDTGIGISEHQYSKIFDRFYQVENSTSRQYEGTGLGLTISRAYVEFLGGKIWLTSQTQKGTTFYFTIPYNPSNRQINLEMKIIRNETGIITTKKSVLIAEDDDNNFYLMKELLSDLNIKIIRASNGIEAVDAFESGQIIDLVLMDVKMPFMDGYEATRQILKKRPHMKIIAQTAYADDGAEALRSGCSGFISKPFVKNKFVSIVKENL